MNRRIGLLIAALVPIALLAASLVAAVGGDDDNGPVGPNAAGDSTGGDTPAPPTASGDVEPTGDQPPGGDDDGTGHDSGTDTAASDGPDPIESTVAESGGGETGPPAFVIESIGTGEIPAPPFTSTPQQTGQIVADFTGDGRDDSIVYGRGGPNAVQLYSRGADGTWTLDVIESDAITLEAGGASGDIDGDGDLDVVIGQDAKGNAIFWWENPGTVADGSTGTGWARRTLLASGANQHHDIEVGDVDRDGRPEVVYWTQGRNERNLYVAEIPTDPTAPNAPAEWPRVVAVDGDGRMEGLALVDVDRDGFTDIVAGGRLITFDPATGGFVEQRISPYDSARFAAADLVPGGHLEVVVGSGDETGPLEWLQWDGSEWVTTSLVSADDAAPTAGQVAGPWVHGHSLDIADIDGDGHLDIFAAEMYLISVDGKGAGPDARSVVWYGDGTGTFTPDVVAVGADDHESYLGDVDGDGRIDIFHKPYDLATPELIVRINRPAPATDAAGDAGTGDAGASGADASTADPGAADAAAGPSAAGAGAGDLDAAGAWTKHVIGRRDGGRAMFVRAGDLDGDGDLDIVTGPSWYENPGTLDGAWTRNEIGAPLRDAFVVTDLDGDGRLDVFGASGALDGVGSPWELAWAKGDGAGGFTTYTNIPAPQGVDTFAQGVAVGRTTPGGPVEVWISWHDHSAGIHKVTVPTAGSGSDPTTTTWSLSLATPVSQGEEIELADLDGDGDMDLVLGHIWLENPGPGGGGAGRPLVRHDIVTPTECCEPGGNGSGTIPLPDRVSVVDIDGDGRLDVVATLEGDGTANRVQWYEQPDSGPTGTWITHEIGGAATPLLSMSTGDVDGDGDVDVVVGEQRTARSGPPIREGRAWVFENTGDGTGGGAGGPVIWTRHTIDATDAHHDGTELADLDGDGDLDVFSIGWDHPRVLVYERR